jgi:hypothetical protein
MMLKGGYYCTNVYVRVLGGMKEEYDNVLG